ncbi:hypothetical protein CGJ08_05910 [Vibrio parahaemolyticus]|nr:hypothetical protein [Vibrio parahaemolyticus]EGR1758229.1 hypothetical protein [Vibrio parahaemolyticus]TOG14057.1 hypothetical protein CGJ08_05910 [Vibrio parahaemolyticus]TOM87471.1 hypothetical protein CGH69_12100 [Vibrio parahaemolyticus]
MLSQGVSREHIWIMGFSQGACMAAEFIRQSQQPMGGAILFTGGLFGPQCPTASAQKPVFDGMTMLLSGSHTDTWVSAERVTQTADYFEQLGASVHLEIFAEREHRIARSEIDLARGLITASFAGVSQGGGACLTRTCVISSEPRLAATPVHCRRSARTIWPPSR